MDKIEYLKSFIDSIREEKNEIKKYYNRKRKISIL